MTSLPLSHRLTVFAADIKISHTVFAMPWAILSTLLAWERVGGPIWGKLGLILVCMVSARTVAMAANRLLDAEIDARNPRTAGRAVPSGLLTRGFMTGALALSAGLFIATTALFWVFYANLWPIALSLPVLAFLAAYPLLKRFSRLCHYYLGAALALAPICAWVAMSGTLAWPPIIMAGAVLLWTAGFDIIYACQDYDFDVAAGLVSIPAKLGMTRALWVARATHILCAGLLILLGLITPELGWLYLIGVGIAIALLIIEHLLVHPGDLSKVNLAFFTINGIISLLLGALGVLDILV